MVCNTYKIRTVVEKKSTSVFKSLRLIQNNWTDRNIYLPCKRRLLNPFRIIKNTRGRCYRCKVKDTKKSIFAGNDFLAKRYYPQCGRRKSRISMFKDFICFRGTGKYQFDYYRTKLFPTNLMELLNIKKRKQAPFIKCVVPEKCQLAWCLLESFLCTAVVSLCYGEHTEWHRARSCDHAAVEWHWQRWLVSHIWHRQSHDSDHWSSS